MNKYTKVNEIKLKGSQYMVLSGEENKNEFIIMGMSQGKPSSLKKDELTNDEILEIVKLIRWEEEKDEPVIMP